MKILAYGSSHDGSVVLLDDSRLVQSFEAEKDSGRRSTPLSLPLYIRSMQLPALPDVIAVGEVFRHDALWRLPSVVDNVTLAQYLIDASYTDESAAGKAAEEILFAGKRITQFSSSHVRSHIMGSYGLSPFPQGEPCYALVWEGYIGSMYYVDENVHIHKIGDVVDGPGSKYILLYALADPAVSTCAGDWGRHENAGKLMALAAYGRQGTPSEGETALINALMSLSNFELLCAPQDPKEKLRDSRYFNIGVESQEFKDLARQFSDATFNLFHRYAKQHLNKKLPLLLCGGCGLNCEWNTRWKESGLFTDVFVPPCTNDSGIGIGAAVDALHHYTGRTKIEWNVYAGEEFVADVTASADFESRPLDLLEVCTLLLKGQVIAWAQGRYELGPRALGNRSLLAAPFSVSTRDRLNRIKQRETFRPIAPVCLEEDFGRHFEHHGPSPHMLYFQRVKSKELAAVTHVDGSARAQTVTDAENPLLCALLREFRKQSGFGVLCNTSLNFKGFGFINRLSHALQFALNRGIDGVVAGRTLWIPSRPK